MSLYLVTVSAVVLVWCLISFIKWRNAVFNPLKHLTPFTWLPVVGTKHKFIGVPRDKLLPYAMKIINDNGPVLITWSGFVPELAVTKPEHLELVMNNTVHITKGRQYDIIRPWLGDGLLTSTGAKWFQHRKMITPTFHFKILESFMEVFFDKTQTLLAILDKKATGQTFDVYPDITHCALDIICETAMGVEIDAMSSGNNEYVNAIYGISEIAVLRILKPFIPDFIFKYTKNGKLYQQYLDILHGFTRKVITERKQLLRNKPDKSQAPVVEDEIMGKKKRTSFLDLLLESSEGTNALSDQDIREEVDTFLFEGHDTTTAGMCWSLLLLGNHADIQERVYEEVSSVLQDKPIPTTLWEVSELKYLELVVKEALRLFPSVPVIGRSVQQDITIDGHTIPAGTQAVLHIYNVHRNAAYYPNPDKFDPDRFLPENSKGRHPYAYIPFSAGPRNCIGQKFAMSEEKTILASIIKRFKLTAVESEKDITPVADLILRPLNGVLLKLERRK